MKWRMSRRILLFTATLAVGAVAGRGLGQLWRRRGGNDAIVPGDHASLLDAVGARWVLFTLSTCRYCARARAWLDEHAVTYVELEIDTSPEALRRFAPLDEPGLPVLVGPEARVRGFIPEAYAALTGR